MSPSAKMLCTNTDGYAKYFRTLIERPLLAQDAQLRDILARNAQCEYGRHYGFASISSYAEFCERVPIVAYDDLRNSIERMANGEQSVLVQEPVIAFEETGGSSGGRKLVPYTAASLQSFQRGLLPWLDDLFVENPELAAGSAYWSISPACRDLRHAAGGLPIGLSNDAAYFGEDMAQAIFMSLSVPPDVGKIRNLDQWRRVTLLYLLTDKSLSLISVWSPSFILELLRFARKNVASLAACIADGRFEKLDSADDSLSLSFPLARRSPDPQRAALVAAVLADPLPRYERIWPNLRIISCWDHASSRPYAEELRRHFPSVLVQGKGLLATEGMTSFPLCDFAMPVLALESGFYEFVGIDGLVKRAHEVVKNEEYELLLTNHSGFYRYAIGDRVRIDGFAGNTPTLEFVGRDQLQSDLCGEKLTEAFVLQVLRKFDLGFSMLVVEAKTKTQAPPGYVLLVDGQQISKTDTNEMAKEIDLALGANPQYSYARRMNQLAPLQLTRCINPQASWLALGMRNGQRLGDIKPPALCTRHDWRDHFELE